VIVDVCVIWTEMMSVDDVDRGLCIYRIHESRTLAAAAET